MYSCTLTFQTLLGSFVQRTSAQQPLSFSSPSFPLFCECKDTAFSFRSNTFLNFFFNYFLFIFHLIDYYRFIMINIAVFWKILPRYGAFLPLFRLLMDIFITKNITKSKNTLKNQYKKDEVSWPESDGNPYRNLFHLRQRSHAMELLNHDSTDKRLTSAQILFRILGSH